MTDAPDADLLEQFVRDHSEAAFAALVERHIGLVHSVALRHTANPQHAEDITQVVFIILARKSAALSSKIILPGWLHHTARLTAANFQRAESRRTRRDQEVFMQSTLNEPAPDPLWPELSPLLDEALSRLRASDRGALVLRYFQNKSLAEVGAAMGLAERAAQKRILRAIEKLRAYFAKRGVTSTADEIAKSISANSVQAVSPALMKAVAATAIAKGAAASTSILTLTKGALKIMAWTKAKTVVFATAVLLLGTTAAITPYVWKYHLSPDAWRQRFEAVYRLRNGELVRHIAPPFIPERLTYYQTNNSIQAKYIPAGPDFMVLKQDEQGRLQWTICSFGSKRYSLSSALANAFELEPYEFEGPNNLLNLTVNGDWTISNSVTNQEALLKALEPILFKVTNHKIIFEKRTVERDVIVVSGDHFHVQPGDRIQLYAENSEDKGYEGYGDLSHFFDWVGNRLGLRLVNETKINPDAQEIQNLTWVNHSDSIIGSAKKRKDELTNELLKHLADQTGLELSHEKRSVDVWFMTEEK
jgi:RNA polymerase sigma factor (sigma-70 family)